MAPYVTVVLAKEARDKLMNFSKSIAGTGNVVRVTAPGANITFQADTKILAATLESFRYILANTNCKSWSMAVLVPNSYVLWSLLMFPYWGKAIIPKPLLNLFLTMGYGFKFVGFQSAFPYISKNRSPLPADDVIILTPNEGELNIIPTLGPVGPEVEQLWVEKCAEWEAFAMSCTLAPATLLNTSFPADAPFVDNSNSFDFFADSGMDSDPELAEKKPGGQQGAAVQQQD